MEKLCEYHLIIYNETSICTSLVNLVHQLYHKLNMCKQVDFFKNIIIHQFYKDCFINTYHIDIRNSMLVMYNDINYIQLTNLFPEYVIVDQMLIKYYQSIKNDPSKNINTNITPNITSNTIPPNAITSNTNTPSTIPSRIKIINPIKKRKHESLLKRAKIAERNINKLKNDRRSSKPIFDEEFEALKEKQRNERIHHGQNKEKIRIFESDKNSYMQIKKDIDNKILDKNDMNPAFVLKYQIFQILHDRNSINFLSNENITEEYNIYNDYYQVCLADEEPIKTDESIKTDEPINKVYIPHKWHYMSDEKKEGHARKYKMTKKEFEDKYINVEVSNDSIENHISKINKESETPAMRKEIILDDDLSSHSDSYSSSHSDSDDSDSDDDNVNIIDPEFIILSNNLN